MTTRHNLTTIRTDAAHLAASFFVDCTPPTEELWRLATFFEAFIRGGGEATREEYAPKPVVAPAATATLRVLRGIE